MSKILEAAAVFCGGVLAVWGIGGLANAVDKVNEKNKKKRLREFMGPRSSHLKSKEFPTLYHGETSYRILIDVLYPDTTLVLRDFKFTKDPNGLSKRNLVIRIESGVKWYSEDAKYTYKLLGQPGGYLELPNDQLGQKAGPNSKSDWSGTVAYVFFHNEDGSPVSMKDAEWEMVLDQEFE